MFRRKRKEQPGVPPRPVGVGDFSAGGHESLIRELRKIEHGDPQAAPSLEYLAQRFHIKREHLDQEIDELCAHNGVQRGSPGWVDQLRSSPRPETDYQRRDREALEARLQQLCGDGDGARVTKLVTGRCWCGEPIVLEVDTVDGKNHGYLWRHQLADPLRLSAWWHWQEREEGVEGKVGPNRPSLPPPPPTRWRRPGDGGSGDREPRHPLGPAPGAGAALEPPTD
jgi:hypothetical protein